MCVQENLLQWCAARRTDISAAGLLCDPVCTVCSAESWDSHNELCGNRRRQQPQSVWVLQVLLDHLKRPQTLKRPSRVRSRNYIQPLIKMAHKVHISHMYHLILIRHQRDSEEVMCGSAVLLCRFSFRLLDHWDYNDPHCQQPANNWSRILSIIIRYLIVMSKFAPAEFASCCAITSQN